MSTDRPGAADGGEGKAARCPTCRRPPPARAPERPFCSPRCKMVDLGRWFDEEYAVPGEAAIDMEGFESPGPARGGRATDEGERRASDD